MPCDCTAATPKYKARFRSSMIVSSVKFSALYVRPRWKPGWPCALMRVGMIVLPVRSTREAARGALTAPLTPTFVITPFSTSMAPLVKGWLPSPGMSRAPSYNTAAFDDRDWDRTGRTEGAITTASTAAKAAVCRIIYLASFQLGVPRESRVKGFPLLLRVTTYLTDQLLNFSNQHSPIASTQHRFTISTINSVRARTTTESRQHFSSFITLNAKGCCVLAIGEC